MSAAGGGGTLSCSGLEALWESAGGSSGTAFMAAEIARAESGGQQYATDADGNGTVDRGYWQVNSIHGALSTYDPAGNARCGRRAQRRRNELEPLGYVPDRRLPGPVLALGPCAWPPPDERTRSPMRHKPRFRLWRPGRRSARRQVAALRAKTAQARMQLADTDAMLAGRRPSNPER